MVGRQKGRSNHVFVLFPWMATLIFDTEPDAVWAVNKSNGQQSNAEVRPPRGQPTRSGALCCVIVFLIYLRLMAAGCCAIRA